MAPEYYLRPEKDLLFSQWGPKVIFFSGGTWYAFGHDSYTPRQWQGELVPYKAMAGLLTFLLSTRGTEDDRKSTILS